jgi:hypothetical protein
MKTKTKKLTAVDRLIALYAQLLLARPGEEVSRRGWTAKQIGVPSTELEKLRSVRCFIDLSNGGERYYSLRNF